MVYLQALEVCARCTILFPTLKKKSHIFISFFCKYIMWLKLSKSCRYVQPVLGSRWSLHLSTEQPCQRTSTGAMGSYHVRKSFFLHATRVTSQMELVGGRGGKHLMSKADKQGKRAHPHAEKDQGGVNVFKNPKFNLIDKVNYKLLTNIFQYFL